VDFLPVIIGLVISIVFALVCWNLAGSRNRSQILWAILGFLFPVIALIILLIIGNKKPKTTS
jgi:hypothetical protein